MSVFGVILARILPHSDWIRRDILYFLTFQGDIKIEHWCDIGMNIDIGMTLVWTLLYYPDISGIVQTALMGNVEGYALYKIQPVFSKE